MKPDFLRRRSGFKMAGNGVANHFLKFLQVVALGRDAAARRIIPRGNQATALATLLNVKRDLGHEPERYQCLLGETNAFTYPLLTGLDAYRNVSPKLPGAGRDVCAATQEYSP